MKTVDVDRAARREMGTLIRRFVAGRLTNFKFEDAAIGLANRAPADPALSEVVSCCLWFWYDDLREHTLSTLTQQQRRAVARILLFLKTDDPYCWQCDQDIRPFAWGTSAIDTVIQLVTGAFLPLIAGVRLVLWVATRRTPILRAPHEPERSYEADIWPFTSRDSLLLARSNIRFIGGTSPCSTP